MKLEVSVDKILNPGDTTYLTHNFHPYAAKFIPQIPRFFIKKFTKPHEVIMDPFCGSGTSLVEAKLLGRNGIGIDLHPIAVLVSKVKTTKLSESEIKEIKKVLNNIEKNIVKLYKSSTLIKYIHNPNNDNEGIKKINFDFPNKDHWFKPHVLDEIGIIKYNIDLVENEKVKNFLKVGLSSIIVQVSNQESETRYAATDKNIKQLKTFYLFKNKIQDMIKRIKEFNKIASNSDIIIYQADSRKLNFIEENSVDFIITSPPYPNTYDYYLYHKLRMYILGYDVELIRENEIGSRNKHSSKKEDISSYIEEMTMCFSNFSKILKPDKFFVIVIGDSIIKGKLIDGFNIITQIAERTGFKVLDELKYSLNLVSKTFNSSFRNKSKYEHIILLKNER